jgi:hypothetical protein
LQKVWTGFHHTQGRASTPSQVPTLPGYRESWGEVWDLDVEKMGDVERRFTVHEKEIGKGIGMIGIETSYYNDSLSDIDEEEELKRRRSISVARMVDVQIVTRTGVPRVVEYIKL